tara:strand:+ start:667 stop:855 length:189 start_codon:yes stop_codon:yes gene_type:complete
MSNEPGSRECRNLINAKENLIEIMQALTSIKNTDHLQNQLRDIYNELEEMHELRRKVEKINP